MDLSLINPYVRVAMHSVLCAHSEICRRIIYDYELIYLQQGSLTFVYDGKSYACKAGDILLIEPGVSHSFHMGEEHLHQPHIHFDITHRLQSEKIPVCFKDRGDMDAVELSWIHENYFENCPRTPLLEIEDKEAFLSLFFAVIEGESKGDKWTQKGNMLSLLAMVVKRKKPALFQTESKPSVARQIKEFIDAKQGLCMRLEDFEQIFFYDKYYLEKCFAKEYGVSLIKYRNQKRMENAKALLKQNAVSVVAERLGYGSIYAFSRAFKLYFGYSPSKEKK